MSSSTAVATSSSSAGVANGLSREDRLKKLAIQSVPSFKGLTRDDLLVKVISGGITNFLYSVYSKEAAIREFRNREAGLCASASSAPSAAESAAESAADASLLLKPKVASEETPIPEDLSTLSIPKEAVVVRVYGKDTDKIISRNEELFWQSQFLHTYAKNHEMLVYEFLYGYRPLDFPELQPRYVEIADKMAELHIKATSTAIFHSAFGSPSSNHSVMMLTQWCQMVSDIEAVKKNIKPELHAKVDSLGWGNEGLEEECGFLLSIINNHAPELPTAVCHNDLLAGNIMVNDKKKDMRIIDFEYTRLNYVYFDIANHFNEYPGLDCDYDTYFPDRQHCESFVREYLTHGRRLAALTAVTRDMDDEVSKALLASIATVGDKEVKSATDLVLFFTLVSNITWAMWALIQEQVSEIDFGYLDYAIVRYNRYLATKKAFTQNL